MQMRDTVHIELTSTVPRHTTELGDAAHGHNHNSKRSVREGDHHTIMAEKEKTKEMSLSRAPKGPRSEPPPGNTSSADSLNSPVRECEHHTIIVGSDSKSPSAKAVLLTNPADKAETPQTTDSEPDVG